MLILTRKPSESIHIGNDVKVTVLGVTGNQVRVGIDAPRETPIDREEVWKKKQRSQQMNANGNVQEPTPEPAE